MSQTAGDSGGLTVRQPLTAADDADVADRHRLKRTTFQQTTANAVHAADCPRQPRTVINSRRQVQKQFNPTVANT